MNRLEYDVGSVAPKCALGSSACAAWARPPRTGDEDVIGIPVADAARVEAKRTF